MFSPLPKNILFLQVGRYIISGSIAAGVLFGMLIVLHEFFGMWYLPASCISVFFTFCTSFILQKFWTFKDTYQKNTRKQFFAYISVGLGNIVINTISMYILVDIFAIQYIISQLMIVGTTAIISFFVYRHFIFNR